MIFKWYVSWFNVDEVALADAMLDDIAGLKLPKGDQISIDPSLQGLKLCLGLHIALGHAWHHEKWLRLMALTEEVDHELLVKKDRWIVVVDADF